MAQSTIHAAPRHLQNSVAAFALISAETAPYLQIFLRLTTRFSSYASFFPTASSSGWTPLGSGSDGGRAALYACSARAVKGFLNNQGSRSN
jgi:hypothetical protein